MRNQVLIIKYLLITSLLFRVAYHLPAAQENVHANIVQAPAGIFSYGINAGVNSSIMGTVTQGMIGTEFGVLFTWQPAYKKATMHFETDILFSCIYDFTDIWILAAGFKAGLPSLGFVGLGASWFLPYQTWYFVGTIMVPFSEITVKETNLHSLVIVSYYVPISDISNLFQEVSLNSVYKWLFIGVVLRLALYPALHL